MQTAIQLGIVKVSIGVAGTTAHIWSHVTIDRSMCATFAKFQAGQTAKETIATRSIIKWYWTSNFSQAAITLVIVIVKLGQFDARSTSHRQSNLTK